MSGGDGADVFVFRALSSWDVITDFDRAEGDRIVLDRANWTGLLTPEQVVARYATVVDNDAVLNFGNGHVLQLNWYKDLAGLAAAIDYM